MQRGATTARSRDLNNSMVDEALVALGLLAVLDNVVSHWLLGAHRVVTSWSGSVYVEVALVLVGVGLVTLGVRRQRRLRRVDSAPRGSDH